MTAPAPPARSAAAARAADRSGRSEPAAVPPAGRRTARVPVAALAWTTAVTGLAAGTLGATYPGWVTLAGLVAVAVLIAALIGGAAALRMPRWLAPAVIVVAALVVSVIAMLQAPRLGAEAALAAPAWRLLLDAVPHLLTTPPGTPARLDLVVPAGLAVVAAQTVACARAVARGPDRPVGVAPAIGGAALYGCALLLSAGAVDSEGVIAGALVVLVLLAWIRPSLPVVGVLLVCGFCATIVAAVAFPPGRDVRTVVTPPTVTVAQPNVLPYLALWADQTDLTLFTVSGRVPDRIALVVYPGFDGTSWSSGGRFALVGTHRSAALTVGTLYAGYHMRVQPGGLPVDWLPSAGTVDSVSLPGVLQDQTGGGLLRIGAHTSPKPYTVTGRVDVADDGMLDGAGVPGADAAGPFLTVPELPDALRDWVDTNIRPFRGRYQQAAALEADLRDGRTLDASAPGSTSVAAIADLVADPSARAPAEVYASAFAVLARSVGLPTRLVVGARLWQHPGVIQTADRAVTSGDMTVWPEVYFSGVGWVPFDPVPGHDTLRQKVHAQIRDGGTPDGPTGGPPEPADVPAPPVAQASEAAVSPVVIAATLGGLVVLILLAAAVVGWIARRRMAGRGAAGAYSLIEGGAVLAGLPVRADASAETLAERVTAATTARAGAAAMEVAVAAQRERFGPAAVGTDPGAWRRAVSVRRALRRTLPWHRRMWWFLRPVGWRLAPLSGARSVARRA